MTSETTGCRNTITCATWCILSCCTAQWVGYRKRLIAALKTKQNELTRNQISSRVSHGKLAVHCCIYIFAAKELLQEKADVLTGVLVRVSVTQSEPWSWRRTEQSGVSGSPQAATPAERDPTQSKEQETRGKIKPQPTGEEERVQARTGRAAMKWTTCKH